MSPVLQWPGPSVTLRTVNVHPSPCRSVRLSSTVWAHPPSKPHTSATATAHDPRFMRRTIGHRRHGVFGSYPGRHYMLQPMLAIWLADGDFPASRASVAARASLPVAAMPFLGRLSAN